MLVVTNYGSRFVVRRTNEMTSSFGSDHEHGSNYNNNNKNSIDINNVDDEDLAALQISNDTVYKLHSSSRNWRVD